MPLLIAVYDADSNSSFQQYHLHRLSTVVNIYLQHSIQKDQNETLINYNATSHNTPSGTFLLIFAPRFPRWFR